jgi:hypothetical protein
MWALKERTIFAMSAGIAIQKPCGVWLYKKVFNRDAVKAGAG